MEDGQCEDHFQTMIGKARDGDKTDRAQLLETFRNFLRSAVSRSIGIKPNGKLSVSDLVQSAIIEANQKFDSCRATNRDEFKAWLRKILINDLLNRFRDLRRQKRDVRREMRLDSKLELADDHDSPINELIQQEDKTRLMEALSKLTPERRQVIELRYRDGLSFVEIAERIGKSPDAVRMTWNRAIESLSKIIGGQRRGQ